MFHTNPSDCISEKYFNSWRLFDFVIVFGLVEEKPTLAEFFILMLVGIVGNVFHDFQWKPVDVLFITGTVNDPCCRHG